MLTLCMFVCVLMYVYARSSSSGIQEATRRVNTCLKSNCFTQENITLILNNAISVVPLEKTFYLLFNAVHQDDKKTVQHVRICPVCSVLIKKSKQRPMNTFEYPLWTWTVLFLIRKKGNPKNSFPTHNHMCTEDCIFVCSDNIVD